MSSFLDRVGTLIPPASRAYVVVTVATVTTVALVTAYKLLHSKRETRKNAATVSKLMIYPIKSVAGIAVDHLNISADRVTYEDLDDRSMIVLNKENRMITLRQNGSLALIRCTFTGKSELTLRADAMEDLVIDVRTASPGTSDEVIHFSVWGHDTSGVEVSTRASEWFSRHLKEPGVRLVKFTRSSKGRPTQVATPKGSVWQGKYKIRYQDAAPIHLTNEASLDALNKSAESSGKQFTIQAFRPNIVVKSSFPLEEMSWFSCTIDCITFVNVRACTRCVIPTMDPATGERDADKTSVMRSHRSAATEYEEKNYQQSPLFGIMLVPNKSGTVTLASSVDVTV